MRFKDLKIGFALTGSHCTIAAVLPYLRLLKEEGARVIPIFSPAVLSTDTRYGTAEELLEKVTEICGEKPLTTLVEVEPIGPQKLLDLVVVAPCTGNTLAKLALGVTDTCVLLACKAQLRNNRPVVIAVSTNDGLSANLFNIAMTLEKKYIYFTPFGQDNAYDKPTSLICDFDLIQDTLELAVQGKQLQPLLL